MTRFRSLFSLPTLIVVTVVLVASGVVRTDGSQPELRQLDTAKAAFVGVNAELPPANLSAARTLALGRANKGEGLSQPLATLANLTDNGTRVSDATDVDRPKDLRDLVSAERMRFDGDRVQVFVHTNDLDAAASAIEAVGGRVDRMSDEQSIVQAWIPAGELKGIAALSSVVRVRLPDYGYLNAGAVASQGDAILNAANVRSTYGVDGSGIRVGVISDGVQGLGASQASGDLPAVNHATCNTVPQNATAPGAGAEGTAMLEIVHDLAPGAELWFGHFGYGFSGTSLDFMEAVDCLAEHTDVVVDDIAWFNVGPYDGSSAVSLNATNELNDGANAIRGYYTSAGNQAQNHYEGPYVDAGSGFHLFQANGTTWDHGGFGPREDNPTIIPAGAVGVVILQWNDPFGASCNDYDLGVWEHNTAILVGESIDPQTCSDDPTEFVVLDNTCCGNWLVDVGIYDYDAVPRTFDMFIIAGYPSFNTPCSSIANNADAAGGVVSLGAIDAADPGWNTIEPFSSCGPTNDGRLKPEAAAIDGVNVTGNGGFPSTFFGTSAAAPHAAAIAALMLDCNGALSRNALRSALLDSAVDLGPAGTDYDFGHGRLNALAAAVAVGCGAGATPTVPPPATPTEPPVATPTLPAGATNTPVPPSATPTRTPTRTPTPAGLVGDVDCNGVVNPIDAALILQWSAGMFGSFPCPQNADTNGDGSVNAIDSAVLLQYYAGFLASLPP